MSNVFVNSLQITTYLQKNQVALHLRCHADLKQKIYTHKPFYKSEANISPLQQYITILLRIERPEHNVLPLNIQLAIAILLTTDLARQDQKLTDTGYTIKLYCHLLVIYSTKTQMTRHWLCHVPNVCTKSSYERSSRCVG